MKRWKRDLGLVRELGPDTRRFDAAVQRVWHRMQELELALEEIAADPYPESERAHELQEIARRALA